MTEDPRLETLRRRLSSDPDARAYTQLCDELCKGRQFAEAVRVAREGLERHPDDAGVRTALGRALLGSGDAESGRKELEAVVARAPGSVLAHRLLGQCLEELGDTASALGHYRAALARSAAIEEDHDLEPAEDPPTSPEGPTTPPARPEAPRTQGSTPARPDPLGGVVPAPAVEEKRRLSLRPIEGSGADTDPTGAGRGDVLYVDFSDEGTVTLAKVSPILESLDNPDSVFGEALRLLGARVQRLRRDRRAGCVAVTSPMPGDGKSSISVGLAGALAREADQQVLLVEADLRRPSLEATLGLPPGPGLSEWLKGELPYVPVSVVEPGGFFLLTAGQGGLDRPEVLGSPRMDALLRAARGLFDFVVLDIVPVMSVTDTVLIQDFVDGFLVVVRSRQTSRDAIKDAFSRLRADKILGVVLNAHDEHSGSYKAYAYGRYGMVEYSRNRRTPKGSGGEKQGR